MEPDIGMKEQDRSAIGGALAKWLADLYTLYVKTQNFHWNLIGSEFYSLHLLFEKHYEELAEEIDEVAERIRALGYFVEASLDSFKKITSIPEDDRVHVKTEMVNQLIQGHELIIREGRKLSVLADKHDDAGTVDMVGRRVGGHEKMAWMLRSQL